MKTTTTTYNPKEVLKDILNAFCLQSQNIDKVYKLSGIKAPIYNGKRSSDKCKAILLRAISNNKAKEIINQMPFPYIETADKIFEKNQRNCHFYIDNVLQELPKKRGNKIECTTEPYSVFYR